MKLSAIIVLCCSVLIVCGDDGSTASGQPSSTKPLTNSPAPTLSPITSLPTAIEPNKTTTIAPNTTTTTTTIAPNTTTTTTTTLSPNTTTTSTTTTTIAPNTTTTSTTTPSPSPNTTTTSTTTVAPSPSPTPSPNTTTTSTTTVAPSPSPKPSPFPEPTTGSWMLNNTNEVCIVIEMAAQFDIKYTTTDKKDVTQKINLPRQNMTQVSGNCSNTKEQNMTISWMNGTSSLTLHFVNDGKTYSLHHIEAVIPSVDLPKINSTQSNVNLVGESSYKANSGNSYKCLAKQNIELKSSLNKDAAIKITNLQFQAFKTDKSTGFSSADDCTDVTDIVPIAVGCVLIALVVLVLVAYLIGRRNSQARGYVSM